ncbi:protocadherin alpha-C2-like [Latimeria chalumnae]|uniref:protocadherin alpha-C2-like n=1 Tax=Latimeria chalumnae TaxID=7897 RepID=UPI0006D90E26|nr:PREDICTED: protocadherin alpha-C2-like [Latimeria chalumnae]|eukprot:XP_014351002.1 PREDICTED: protocadherin alpha-C2-like [Latimeria chalumnae]
MLTDYGYKSIEEQFVMSINSYLILQKMIYINGVRNLGFQLFPWILFVYCVEIISGNIYYSIPEELQHGTLVGNIAEDLGLEIAKLSSRGFRLVSDDSKDYFLLNLENGNLFVKTRIDREDICGVKTPCFINMEAVMNNPLEFYNVKVEVQDINDNSPTFPVKEIYFNITESVAAASRYLLESAQDPDVGFNSLSTYQLSSSDHFSLEIQTHSDGFKMAELVLEKSLDREQQSSHYLVLKAIDGGTPQRSGTTQVIINVLDANDNPPRFHKSVFKASLMEGAPIGTLVIDLNATDVDQGANGEIIYSFSTHTPQNLREIFSVNSRTGEITVNEVVNLEETKVYELYVQAMDNGQFALTSHCRVLVEVIDINNNAPEVILTSSSNSIPENTSIGTVIALFSVTDKDSGINGQVHCFIPNKSPFKLRSIRQSYYTLTTDGPLDRETTSLYNVTVIATDSGSPPLSTEKTILVHISDINDNSPRFTQESYSAYVTENNVKGYFICQVRALDPDLDQNGLVTYSLLETQVGGVSVFNYVSINAANGSIYAQSILDYEKLQKFEMEVKATDGGTPPLSSKVRVVLNIVDQNDNNPIFLYPSTAGGSVEIIPRSAKTGFLVTKVITDDADTGQNAWLSYQLLHSTDDTLISVDKQTGEIRTQRSIKATDTAKQKMIIQVRDNGQPPLSATVTIGLLLTDSLPQVLPDFVENSENQEKLSDINVNLVIALGFISLVFLGFVVIFSMKLYRFRSIQHCCRNACCVEEYDSYKRNYQLPPNSWLAPDFLKLAGTGTLPHAYKDAYQNTWSDNSNIMFLRGCSQTGVRSNLSSADAKVSGWCEQVPNGNENGDENTTKTGTRVCVA